MLAQKTAIAAEHFHVPIGQNKSLGHFPAPFGCIDRQGANAPVDINLTVRKGGTCQERQFIQRFAMRLKV